MNSTQLPGWIPKHLYQNKSFRDLNEAEFLDLKNRLAKFSPHSPEISIVIPAWNEGDNIHRTLSSLAESTGDFQIEIIVINNNSTDHTQEVLDQLAVRNYFQPLQGIAHARQMGLEKARGKYHLCADADTFYPPHWAETMIRPMANDPGIAGVYGRYSFMPPEGEGRLFLWLYEKITGILIRIRKKKREHINFLGFNMGFVTEIGRITGGFNVARVRQFSNAAGDEDFVDESEDGRMALNLKKIGSLKLITDSRARVFTSSRRLQAEGGILQSFINRLKLHTLRLKEYVAGSNIEEGERK